MVGAIGYRESADKRMLQGEDQVEHKRHQCRRQANQSAVDYHVRCGIHVGEDQHDRSAADQKNPQFVGYLVLAAGEADLSSATKVIEPGERFSVKGDLALGYGFCLDIAVPNLSQLCRLLINRLPTLHLGKFLVDHAARV